MLGFSDLREALDRDEAWEPVTWYQLLIWVLILLRN